jgi:hypothetical protein
LDGDSSRRSSSRRNAAIFSLISSASCFGPANPSSQSSAYADIRVMPTGLLEALPGGRVVVAGAA